MNLIHSTAATLLALIFTLLSPMAIAGAGHDHGEAAPQAQAQHCRVSSRFQRIWKWLASSMASS